MPLIKKVNSRVELWRDEYTDAKLKTGTANELATPRSSFQNNKEREEYTTKYITPMKLLEQAVVTAPVMGRLAVGRIKDLIQSTANAPSRSPLTDMALSNTVMALYKYFGIPLNLRELGADDPAWQTVKKICALYGKTVEGMSQPYRIYLYEPQNFESAQVKALGFVRHPKVEAGQHPLDIYFRTPPDDNGHVPYPHWLETGHIHIRMDALSQKGASDESVARLLFHEATHKWANTKDICYKWDTIAQKYKHTEWNKAVTNWKTDKAKTLATKIRDNIQPTVDRGSNKKPLMPLAKEGVAATEWVYNADSYAWAAYRLWKKAYQAAQQHDWSD